MGLAVNFIILAIFFGVIALILGGICLLGLFVFIYAKKKKWWVLQWLSGGVIGFIILSCLLWGGLIVVVAVRSLIPSCVFTDTFNVKPGDKVRNIKSDFWSAGDHAHTFLSFETDVDTFKSLIPPKLLRLSAEDIQEHNWQAVDGPSWWKDIFSSSDIVYYYERKPNEGEGFGSRLQFMAFDTQQKTAYYLFWAID